jgi:anti-sigma B factor antagonist
MIVEKRRHGAHTVLQVEGVVRMGESAKFLAQTLDRLLAEDQGNVLIDLERINYIDSTGIGELVGYLGQFGDRRRKLILVNPTDRIRKLLEVARLAELFAIYDTVDEAVEAEGSGPGAA